MKDLFKNRSFTLLFTGSLVSEMGNVLFGFVAGLYVQDLLLGQSNSGLFLALFVALGAAVRLIFSPIAGVLVDRWNKVRIIYLTDFIRGILFLATAYVFFGDLTISETITILLIITGLSGLISAFFGPAVTSAIPEIVGLKQLQQANGAASIIQSVTMILGVILGAVAFGLVSFPVAILINSISFMISGFSEMFIRTKHKTEVVDSDEPKSMYDDFQIGFAYLLKKRGLLTLVVYSLFLNFALSPVFSVGIPYLFRTELSRGEWDIAWLNIAFGVAMMLSGVIIGGVVIKSMTKVIRRNLVLLSTTFIIMTLVIFALSENLITYWVFYSLMIVVFCGMAVFMIGTNIPLNTGMVKVIDPEVRGRVFSTVGAISGGAVPISMVLAGIIIDLSSVAVLGIICSVILLFPTIGFMTNKKVKTLLDNIPSDDEEELEVELHDEPVYSN